MDDDRLIAGLKTVRDFEPYFKYIALFVERGDTAHLKSLFWRIIETYPHPDKCRAASDILEQIVIQLSLSAAETNAHLALELANGLLAYDDYVCFLPTITTHIVQRQSFSTISQLLSSRSDLETQAILLHEAVLYQKIDQNSEIVQKIIHRLEEIRHPLAELPLTLLPEEDDLSTQLLRGYGCSDFLQWKLPKVDETHNVITGPDVICEERKRLMASAFINHEGLEVYRWDARVFRIEAPFKGFYPTLMNAPVPCIDQTRQLIVHTYANGYAAWQTLLGTGGAYGSDDSTPFHRLKAWRSYAAMVGFGPAFNFEEVSRVAAACQWALFEHESDWFYQIAWDIGICCWNPIRKEFSILAATAED